MFTLHFEAIDGWTALEHAITASEGIDISETPLIKFVTWQVEEGDDTHAIHWQGYVELTSPCRMAKVFREIPFLAHAHLEARRGTAAQAIAYCQKNETRKAGPWTHGEPAVQGGRTDLTTGLQLLSLYIDEHENVSARELAVEFPELFIRYHGGIAALLAARAPPLVADVDFIPRPWQRDLLSSLSLPACDRKIHWITDVTGGKGKTRLMLHLVRNYGAMNMSGQLKDMIYAFCQSPCRIVCFDITRAAADMSDHLYTMGEALKSGLLFSTKYQSRQASFPSPHVVFFSNQTWDRHKMSLDRVIEVVL